MKNVGGLMRVLGAAVVGMVLLAGPAQAVEPKAAPAVAAAAEMDSPSKRFEQRYAEREQANESLASFEGGQGSSGIYIGGTTIVVVLLVVLLLVLL